MIKDKFICDECNKDLFDHMSGKYLKMSRDFCIKNPTCLRKLIEYIKQPERLNPETPKGDAIV